MATIYRIRSLLTLFLIVLALPITASEGMAAGGRRSNPSASWNSDSIKIPGTLPLPSQQTHMGPMLFATFSQADIAQERVSDEIARQLQSAYLRGHTGSHVRAALYRDFISRELQSRRLPTELITVAFIESAFRIRAESRTGARGLWQFADNSMEPWMRANETGIAYDQRFDFWISTRAAIEKLQHNFRTTGSWVFALGAYNGGLGRMTRSMNGGSFWSLETGNAANTISEEMANYLPRYIATSIIAMYPGRFGIDTGWARPFEWERRLVSNGLSLEAFAEDSGIPLSLLVAGNAEYLEGYIPSGPYYVKYPARYAGAVLRVLGLPSEPRHMVEPGDTLWSISRRYAVNLEDLRRINRMGESNALKVGEYLRIPPQPADNSNRP